MWWRRTKPAANQSNHDCAQSERSRRTKTMKALGLLGRAYRLLAILVIGFAGGSMAPWFVAWLDAADLTSADPVAIANTFIVFTTIIFVGVTLIIAVVSYVVMAQLAATRELQERQLLDELRERLATDEALGVGLGRAMMENPDVRRYLQDELKAILGGLQPENGTADESERGALRALATQLDQNGANAR